jgi:hypothetical protein
MYVVVAFAEQDFVQNSESGEDEEGEGDAFFDSDVVHIIA